MASASPAEVDSEETNGFFASVMPPLMPGPDGPAPGIPL